MSSHLHTINISNPDKCLYPGAGISKGDVVAYYERIAEHLLPHLSNRPVSLERYPDGIEHGGFYQKAVPAYFPDWIERTTVTLKETGHTQEQVVVQNTHTLRYLVDHGTLTFHPWLSHISNLTTPDRLIFDIDPPNETNFQAVKDTARDVRAYCDARSVTSFVMSTGGTGLHVLIPLAPTTSFDDVREVAKTIAHTLAEQHPERYTVETRKDKRNGKIFLDYLRNAYGQTAVAPYALRPTPGAPVATPLEWDELDRITSARAYTLKNIFRRLAHKADPWADLAKHQQSLTQLVTN